MARMFGLCKVCCAEAEQVMVLRRELDSRLPDGVSRRECLECGAETCFHVDEKIPLIERPNYQFFETGGFSLEDVRRIVQLTKRDRLIWQRRGNERYFYTIVSPEYLEYDQKRILSLVGTNIYKLQLGYNEPGDGSIPWAYLDAIADKEENYWIYSIPKHPLNPIISDLVAAIVTVLELARSSR